jgi:hypothetical protein
MGRAAVRQVLTQYLTDAKIPFVGKVYSARPFIVDEDDYEVSIAAGTTELVGNTTGTGAVLICHLPDSNRERVTMTGRKFVDDKTIHDVVLELLFANNGGDAVVAQDDHDTICDAITVALRADPLLGNPQVVWSSGEFRPIKVEQHEPYCTSESTTVFIPTTLTFQVWEWIAGPSGV